MGLEVTLALLDFHRPLFVEVDETPLSLGKAVQQHFLDDLGDRIRLGFDGSAAWRVAILSLAMNAALASNRDTVLMVIMTRMILRRSGML